MTKYLRHLNYVKVSSLSTEVVYEVRKRSALTYADYWECKFNATMGMLGITVNVVQMLESSGNYRAKIMRQLAE